MNSATTLPADCTIDCHRCTGNGRLDRYAHIHGGVCFLCHGTKRRPNAKGKKVLELRVAEEKIAKLAAGPRNALKDAALAATREHADRIRKAIAV